MGSLSRAFLAAGAVGVFALGGVAQDVPRQEPLAGGEWVSLFDGETLDGWTQLNGTAEYAVEDGAIVGTTVAGSPNSFLCSDRYFGDFELTFEVKLFDDALNSGVQIRSHSLPSYRDGRVHGYQVEISTNHHAGFIYDEARRGWLSTDRTDPVARGAFENGEWNRYRVVAVGPVMKTWVNGIPVAEVHDDWSPTGFLGLQVHAVRGDPQWRVAWRNIRIREIGDGGGWASLFDGESLDGWKVNENPDSVRVEDGAIVVQGERAHVFYDGPVHNADFRDFDFRCLVMTKPGANSGVYFHTTYQESGWPAKGYEVQINNTQSDARRTGGLYAIDDVREAPARDGEWFALRIRVVGRHVQVWVDGRQTVDYTEPEDVERPEQLAGRVLDRGTFALQCHDPGSEVHYKQLVVRPLAR